MYGERVICEGPFDAPRDNGDICITTTRNAAVFFEALEGFTKDNISEQKMCKIIKENLFLEQKIPPSTFEKSM